jgi:enoyl-CoA hydratase
VTAQFHGLVQVEFDQGNGIAVVVLNDPAHRNVLSRAMSDAVAEAVASTHEAGARAIVLAASPPVFCAGGSVDDLLDPPGPLAEAYAGVHALADCPVPTIAAVGGAAIGAGVSLPLACDVMLVSDEARFDPRFLDVAIHPGGGHLWELSRRVGPQGAAALVLCGDVLSGEDAARTGLAWRCVPPDQLLDTAKILDRRAASRSPELVVRTKDTLRRTAGLNDRHEAERLELEAQKWSVAQPAHLRAVRALRDRVRKPPEPE